MELSLINPNNKKLVEKEIIKKTKKIIKKIIINVEDTAFIKQTKDKIFCNLG